MIVEDIYKIYLWWIDFFKTKAEEDKDIVKWMENHLVYENGVFDMKNKK